MIKTSIKLKPVLNMIMTEKHPSEFSTLIFWGKTLWQHLSLGRCMYIRFPKSQTLVGWVLKLIDLAD